MICILGNMDPSQVNVKAIDQEVRYRIFKYLWDKGVRSSQLGYHPTTLNRVKNRVIPISDALLKRMLAFLSVDEFAKLITGKEVKPALSEPKDLGEAVIALNYHADAIASIVERFPQLSGQAYQKLSEVIRDKIRDYSITVTEEQVRKFEKLIADRARKTVKDHMRYLRKALSDLGYELSPDGLQEYLIELKGVSPHVARHVSKALKLFIKSVIMPRDLWLGQLLYNSFKTVKCDYSDHEFPSLEEVRAVAKAIKWIPAKAYFAFLAETGLRPGEVLNLRLSDVDFENRTVRPKRLTNTKRAYISFFSPKLRDFLVNEYLPYRDKFIEEYGPRLGNLIDTSDWSLKLFPFKPSHLRAEIYKAMDEALGRRFRIYDLRGFFFSYMTAKGVSPYVVNLLQGRMPPKEYRLAQMHYLAISEEELREIYDRVGLSVL